MSCCGVEIEEGWMVGIQTLELHFAVTATEVERLFVVDKNLIIHLILAYI